MSSTFIQRLTAPLDDQVTEVACGGRHAKRDLPGGPALLLRDGAPQAEGGGALQRGGDAVGAARETDGVV